jgi:hypothetical protein
LLDAFDEGQIENYAQTVHSAVSLRLLSCYVTNMIDENRDCRGRGRLADASFAADVCFAPQAVIPTGRLCPVRHPVEL